MLDGFWEAIISGFIEFLLSYFPVPIKTRKKWLNLIIMILWYTLIGAIIAGVIGIVFLAIFNLICFFVGL